MQDSVVPFEVIICGLVVLLTLLAIFSFVQLLVNATAGVSWAHYGRSDPVSHNAVTLQFGGNSTNHQLSCRNHPSGLC